MATLNVSAVLVSEKALLALVVYQETVDIATIHLLAANLHPVLYHNLAYHNLAYLLPPPPRSILRTVDSPH